MTDLMRNLKVELAEIDEHLGVNEFNKEKISNMTPRFLAEHIVSFILIANIEENERERRKNKEREGGRER